MSTIAIIQARMSSSRLPGKVLRPLADKSVLQHIYDAANRISGVDKVVIATSNNQDDQAIVEWSETQGAECYMGDLNDVLLRFYDAAKAYDAKTVIRLTADCPLLDSHVAGEVLALFNHSHVDYCANIIPPTWPDGLDCEVMSFEALERAHKEAVSSEDREHVTRYIRRNRSLFSTRNMLCPVPDIQTYRWTLDTEDDFTFLDAILSKCPENPSYLQILYTIKKYPELAATNTQQSQSRAFVKSEEKRSFARSKALLEQAETIIPFGTQTFSKSKLNCNPGHAPLFASHGYGGKIWDADGNEYVDLVMGLLPTTLGYCDQDVDQAVRNQLDKGVTMSLSTELEYELGQKIIDMVPCAEKVRFGKNGTDATSAAIRLARAHTGRDEIIVCGYHGWQDWYIGTTARHFGVPDAVRGLTHKVDYNDLDAVAQLLESKKGKIAALIMEPMNVEVPKEGYLEGLKDLLHQHGALFIFDEVITGFRFAKGGAQEYFGVTPDLAAFGKGMGNGMPISAIVGRADIMDEMERIFFSGTFGGEALSLAASIAVLDKIQSEPVIETLWDTGTKIKEGLDKILGELGLEKTISLGGLAPWYIAQIGAHGTIPPTIIKTYMTHELFKQGVLTLGSHNICYAHTQKDIDTVIEAYAYVLEKLKHLIDQNCVEDEMDYPAITPVFTVRKTA